MLNRILLGHRQTKFAGPYCLLAMACLIVFGGLPAAAQQNVSAANSPTVTLVKDPGKPIRFVISDGREATLKLTRPAEGIVLTLPLQITDNTCTNRQGMTCHLSLPYQDFRLYLAWTKNPDPTKIGQTVKTLFQGGNSQPNETNINVIGLPDHIMPSLTAHMPAAQLSCADFSWLPGGQRSAPEALHISRWASEDNAANPETDQKENRTISEVYGINFTRTGPHTLSLQSYLSAMAVDDNDPGLIGTATMSISLQNTDGQTCQVGLAGAISSDIIGQVEIFYKSLADKTDSLDITPESPVLRITNGRRYIYDLEHYFSNTQGITYQ